MQKLILIIDFSNTRVEDIFWLLRNLKKYKKTILIKPEKLERIIKNRIIDLVIIHMTNINFSSDTHATWQLHQANIPVIALTPTRYQFEFSATKKLYLPLKNVPLVQTVEEILNPPPPPKPQKKKKRRYYY